MTGRRPSPRVLCERTRPPTPVPHDYHSYHPPREVEASNIAIYQVHSELRHITFSLRVLVKATASTGQLLSMSLHRALEQGLQEVHALMSNAVLVYGYLAYMLPAMVRQWPCLCCFCMRRDRCPGHDVLATMSWPRCPSRLFRNNAWRPLPLLTPPSPPRQGPHPTPT
jgi:hypothetical protein